MPFGLDVVYDYIKAVIARLWPEPPTEAVSSSSPSPSLRSTSSYDSYPSLPSPSGALRSEYWVPVDPPLSPPLWQWHAPRLITLPGAEADSGEESEEDVPIRHILQRRTGNTSTRVTFVAPVTTSPGSSFQPTPRATDVVSSSKALVDYPSSSEDELARTDAGFMGDVMETGRGSGVARTVRVADGSQENVRSQSSNKERAITASEEANQSGSETSGVAFIECERYFKVADRRSNPVSYRHIGFKCTRSQSRFKIASPPLLASSRYPGDIHFNQCDEGTQYWVTSAGKTWEVAMEGTSHPVFGRDRVLSHRSRADNNAFPQWVLRSTLISYRSRRKQSQNAQSRY